MDMMRRLGLVPKHRARKPLPKDKRGEALEVRSEIARTTADRVVDRTYEVVDELRDFQHSPIVPLIFPQTHPEPERTDDTKAKRRRWGRWL